MPPKNLDETDPLAHLDRDTRKRLEKLSGDWNTGDSFFSQLTARDLRLLLEHHRPLHALIRQIAASAAGQTVPTAAAQAALEHACAQAISQRDACAQDNLALRQQLDTEEKQQAKLAAENRRLAGKLEALEREASQLRAQLRQQLVLPPALELLRSDSALALRLGLGDLPDDDSLALIRSVAVLAQMGTIERLWDALKERCEKQGRAASREETALLQTALDWHNHNWHDKPYRLHTPAEGAGYDFALQQRVAATPGGDALSAIWLPAIVAGNGAVQKKALVATR